MYEPLCCCPPTASVYIETSSRAVFVENEIDMKRRLMVRADSNASVNPPSGPDVNADGSGGSQLDEGTFKKQGKVYRTDCYTVHWHAHGDGPLRVRLTLNGAVSWSADWLPTSGKTAVSANHLLEPPDYSPRVTTRVTARLEVFNCQQQRACIDQQVSIP